MEQQENEFFFLSSIAGRFHSTEVLKFGFSAFQILRNV